LEVKQDNIKALSDDDLIKSIINSGNMDLFSELYDRYGNKVYRKVISMVKDMETSKDLTQEILVKSFLSLAKFEGKSKFSTWLYMITYNYCIDYLRKKKRAIFSDEQISENHHFPIQEEIYEKEVLEMEFDRLETLLELLPVNEKTMLLMYYQDDMTIKELQDHFQIGASAIKMRLSRTRAKLKRIYDEKYGN
jgi:RNA polymerase sigma-70 factor (ECF subfamily)